MNFNTRVIKSIQDIANSVKSLTDLSSLFGRIIGTTRMEVKIRAEKYGQVIKLPDIIKQINGVSDMATSAQFLEKAASMAGGKSGNGQQAVQKIKKYSDLVSKALGSGTPIIFNKVNSLQLGIEGDAFTKYKDVVETLGEMAKTLK